MPPFCRRHSSLCVLIGTLFGLLPELTIPEQLLFLMLIIAHLSLILKDLLMFRLAETHPGWRLGSAIPREESTGLMNGPTTLLRAPMLTLHPSPHSSNSHNWPPLLFCTPSSPGTVECFGFQPNPGRENREEEPRRLGHSPQTLR